MTHSLLSVGELLPAELWLKIFGIIAQLETERFPSDTLTNVSSTCQTFRSFVLPLMYHTFFFHPFIVDIDTREPWNISQRSMPSPNRINREVRRLDFYGSESIAAYVRHLHLQPWMEIPIVSAMAPDDLDSLFRRFYEVLPQFTNVESLTCTNTDFDDFALQQLCRLPNLRSIDLIGCKSPPPASKSVHLHIFKFLHYARPTSLETLGVDRWLALLDPNRLEVLQVAPDRTSSLFFHNIGSAGPFQSLSTMDISVSRDMLSQIPLLLSKTPALRILLLDVSVLPAHAEERRRIAEGWKPSLTSPTPYLVQYRGPHELLHLILARSATESQPLPLRQLRLTSLVQGGDPFAVFWHTLSSPAYSMQLRYLTRFHAKFRSIECDHLAKLIVLLPDLQELSLEAADREGQVTQETFLDDLSALPLSSRIRSLSIDWTAGASVHVDSKHRAIKDHLLTRFPTLRRLWLCDWMRSALLWNRPVSGEETLTVHETAAVWRNFQAFESRHAVFSTVI